MDPRRREPGPAAAAAGGLRTARAVFRTAGDGARFALLVHHTDAEREWAYDRTSPIGRLDKALDQAHEEGWAIADMKRDWKVVYPAESMPAK